MSGDPHADLNDDPDAWTPDPPPGPNGSDNSSSATGKMVGRLRVLSVADLLALPTRDYLVKGVLSPAEISLLVGAKNSRKTFLALHIFYGLAQGWPTILG